MDVERYRNERRSQRTEQVKVPQLSPYFRDGEEPLFTIRNMTAAEVWRAREAGARREEKLKIVEKMFSGNHDERAHAIKQLTDGPVVPDEIAKRIEMLSIACVSPAIDHEIAVRISEDFPIEFLDITNKIASLSGVGAQLGKPQSSGKAKK